MKYYVEGRRIKKVYFIYIHYEPSEKRNKRNGFTMMIYFMRLEWTSSFC